MNEIGLFKEGFIGEDLELTWRVHKAGYIVGFEPRAIVSAETPHTWKTLWNQRVRWGRGFIQTLKIHHDLMFRKSAFGIYLPINVIAMLIIPILQFISLLLLPMILITKPEIVATNAMGVIGWLGLGFALMISIYAVMLDRSWGDLKNLWIVPLWIPYSLFIDAVIIRAILLEFGGTEAKWNKMDRRGDVV
jgi:cellulose synthase/poly-beta-1,6-N-acetylglucosamine synthase-like glycosyltransferase